MQSIQFIYSKIWQKYWALRHHKRLGPTGKELEFWPQIYCGSQAYWDGHFAVLKFSVAQS